MRHDFQSFAELLGVWITLSGMSVGLGCAPDRVDETPELHLEFSDPVSAVDPRIGTGGGGFGQPQAFVGAAVPFGMVKPGPDTEGPILGDLGFAHTAGYWWYDDTIHGFSQLHLHGTGIDDYGQFPLMPTLGMDSSKTTKEGYKQRFSHDTEVARPGYWAVTLEDTGIRAELTATEHAGMHRYTFPLGATQPTVILDASRMIGRDDLAATVTVSGSPDSFLARLLREASWSEPLQSAAVVSAVALSAGAFTGDELMFPVQFFGAFFPEPATWGTFTGDRVSHAETASGNRVGAWLTFPEGTTQVQVVVGLSFRDLAASVRNAGEIGRTRFDQVVADASSAWRSRLETIEVYGATAADRRIFYTALYHAMLMPTLLSEADGIYVGLDWQKHDDGDIRYYSDLSLWDTYRTLHPLYTLMDPAAARDFAETLVRMSEQFGAPPRWPLAVNETGVMIGSPGSIVMAEAAIKGIDGWRDAVGYAFAVSDARGVAGHTIRGSDAAACGAAGWCPADEVGSSVAKTLEYGWADWSISNWAAARGDHAAAREFRARSHGWVRLWDPETQFLRGRLRDGTWTGGFAPLEWSDDYREGDAWQYLWEVPWDVARLAALFGSVDAMLGKLDDFFALAQATPPIYLSGNIRDKDPYYWHGNEPDIHAPYLYALAGRPDRGARWIEWVRRSKYSDGPDGLDGNDDAGTLSSWFILSSLGFYPLAGSDVWIIGLPLWPRAVIHRRSGDLVIRCEGPGADYAAAVSDRTQPRAVPVIGNLLVDGRAWSTPWITHAELAAAREVVFVLEYQAASAWGHVAPFGSSD